MAERVAMVDSNKFDSNGHGSILKDSNKQAKILIDVRLHRVVSKIKDSPAYAPKNVQVRTYSANIPKSMLYKNRPKAFISVFFTLLLSTCLRVSVFRYQRNIQLY